jgi:drug/metabolite transporter (DMT)-like permease
LVATLLYAISLNTIKYKLQEVPSVAITALSFLFVGPLAAVAAYYLGAADVVTQKQGAVFSLLMIAVLAIMGTAIAVILFNIIIKMTTAVFASSVTYLIPIVAILWAVADGEQLNLLHYLGMALILAGVYLVNRKWKKNFVIKTK